MNKYKTNYVDFLFIGSICLALYFSAAILLLIPVVILRARFNKPNIEFGHWILIAGAAYALVIIAFRGVEESGNFIAQKLFIWSTPFIVLLYKPSGHTLQVLKIFLFIIFSIDFSFNLFAITYGHDIFNRELDMREGLSSIRLGGLLAHSFYSGSISILAYAFLITKTKNKWLAIIPATNLIMAGSIRFLIPIVFIPYFYWNWQTRSKLSEISQILIISIITVFSVIETSSYGEFFTEENSANSLRVYAWLSSISSIIEHPLQGVGYSNTSYLSSIDEYTIVKYHIGESWYLNSGLAFGVPYVLLRLLGYMLIFYGKNYINRSPIEAILVPISLIDSTYGETFESLLFSIVLWSVICNRRIRNYNGSVVKIVSPAMGCSKGRCRGERPRVTRDRQVQHIQDE